MKTNELRLGNYISFHNVWYKIVGIEKERVLFEYHNGETDYCYIDYIEPIELTEELLVKIGFEKFEKLFRMKLGEFHLDYFIVVGVLRIYKKITDCYFDKNLEIKCEFLHQLQNAYYLLTNEELEVEL
jgi:hypothetical protein